MVDLLLHQRFGDREGEALGDGGQQLLLGLVLDGAALVATDCGTSPMPYPPYGAAPPPPPAEAGSDAEGADASSVSEANGDEVPPGDGFGTSSDAPAPADAGDESPGILPPYGGPPKP